MVCTPEVQPPAGTQTRNRTFGPSRAIPSLLIIVVLSPFTDLWRAITNTRYDGMTTSLGIVQTLIHCLIQGSVVDKPITKDNYRSLGTEKLSWFLLGTAWRSSIKFNFWSNQRKIKLYVKSSFCDPGFYPKWSLCKVMSSAIDHDMAIPDAGAGSGWLSIGLLQQ